MTLIHKYVEECRAGTLERCIGRMKSGWAVVGDPQIREGYCLLYPDPVVKDLNELMGPHRIQFMSDMAHLGDAVLTVTGADRINYEILGNMEPALHVHVIPRSASESEIIRTKPIWLDDWEIAPRFDKSLHGDLLKRLRQEMGF